MRQLFHWPVAGRRMDWEILYEPRDLWIGVFWDKRTGEPGKPWMAHDRFWHVYVCLLPCLPWHIWWYANETTWDD